MFFQLLIHLVPIMTFISGKLPKLSNEQKRMRSLAKRKPSRLRELSKPSACVSYKGEAAQRLVTQRASIE
jgi:hypothetical protein